MYKPRSTLLAGATMLASTIAAATDNDLLAERALLDKARSEVDASVQTMLVKGADVEVTLPYAPLLAAVAQLNMLPQEQRRVTLQSYQRNGHLWEDGPTWCNSYAEIQGPNDLRATADLSAFDGSAATNGMITLNVHVDIVMNAQVHWHFMGRRVTVFGGGVCPPGGGFGGSIGASGQTGVDLASRISFAMSPDGGALTYGVDLVSPPTASMTLSFGFQNIGNLGIPMSMNLPLGRVASGEVPLLFGQTGEIVLPDKSVKKYQVKLKPVSVHADQSGLAAAWTESVTFQ